MKPAVNRSPRPTRRGALAGPPQLQIRGYMPGSASVLEVYFWACEHRYRVLDDDLDGLARRGCVQCRVNRATRGASALSRAEQGQPRDRYDSGGRVSRQADKLVFDCR